ncbi:DUF3581 family protein [Umboniibacter marinipuniceus]|uniref:Uncharacterized protein DUF3581 n=1 Tax=Umboniibacter marinipuniceus TaxID=569599 RepID=A0A3M0AB66_9GAMM|nr:DUF3581 family protein [Umboniibacter marinipuniceus]RMA82391.1 uncharacterized protein DUF3581 [Umboniibacter marinipuniceus]
MLVTPFFQSANGLLSFTREQGCRFAKEIANDFNPIHDVDAKRFCIPGDLLFSVLLSQVGICRELDVNFAGMVTDQTRLKVVTECARKSSLVDENDKPCLNIEHSNDGLTSPELIDQLTEAYVAFSGESFPHILVPLMAEHQVMINPDRPIVMYTDMMIRFEDLNFSSLALRMSGSELEVMGKRGNVILKFEFVDGDRVVGRGEKHMVLSGLRAYDQAGIDQMVETYSERKNGLVAA